MDTQILHALTSLNDIYGPFAVIAVVLSVGMIWMLFKQARRDSRRDEQEEERARRDAALAEARDQRDNETLKSFLGMIAAANTQGNRAIESMGRVAESVDKLAVNSGKLAEQVQAANQQALEDREAASISRQHIASHIKETNAQLQKIGGAVAENFTLINGVSTTMAEICQRLERLQTTIEDAGLSAKIEDIQKRLNEVQALYHQKKQSTDETPAVPAPDAEKGAPDA